MPYKHRITSMCSYGTNRKLSTSLALLGKPSILLLVSNQCCIRKKTTYYVSVLSCAVRRCIFRRLVLWGMVPKARDSTSSLKPCRMHYSRSSKIGCGPEDVLSILSHRLVIPNRYSKQEDSRKGFLEPDKNDFPLRKLEILFWLIYKVFSIEKHFPNSFFLFVEHSSLCLAVRH